jgi:hypothetical protein
MAADARGGENGKLAERISQILNELRIELVLTDYDRIV